MLRLYDAADLARAKKLMAELQPAVNELFAPDDKLSLKGLNYMNDDPSEVRAGVGRIRSSENPEGES